MSTGSRVEWTERFDESAAGADHLGMRLAGESAYGPLLDFTTTVTWRPRYFSMLCWLFETAFAEAGGRRGEAEHHVNPARYQEVKGRRERALAAATLLADKGALRIIGFNSVDAALRSADAQGADSPLASNGPLANVPNSYATYAGPMIRLGLLEVVREIVRPQEGRGLELAQAFKKSLLAGGTQSVALLDSEELPRKALKELGTRCGLAQLASASNLSPEVAAERDVLRETLLDWERFENGHGPSSRRILSIGMILKLHSLAADAQDVEVELSHFRQATLLDGVCFRPGYSIPFKPDGAYASVHAEWRMYQGHAYVTYASESLLAYVLARATRLQAQHPSGAPISLLLEEFMRGLEAGGAKNDLPVPGFESWWREPLANVVARMEGIVAAGRSATVTEAEWMDKLELVARRGKGTEFGRWAHGASWMLLLAITRLKFLLARDGKETWKGETDPRRLPPLELVTALEMGCSAGHSTQEFLRDWLHRRIILQHQRNALRKLAADPKRDTLKFELVQERLSPFDLHDPGTTNPRFDNAVLFLKDLGYLSPGKAARLTSDGQALLARIEQETRS